MDDTGEFVFSGNDFERIVSLLSSNAGIVLTDAKRQMVYSRLTRRLRALGMSRFDAYLDFVEESNSPEKVNFINALTTNLTSFFREKHHFEYLSNVLLPRLVDENNKTKKLRIWSAGCSTGEEPYTIAMVLRESTRIPAGWDIKILATDLDTNVIATAKQGVYTAERVSGISQDRLSRWFLRGKGGAKGHVRVKPELQQLISFRPLNLLGQWPMKGAFDIIFCRNVVIYFNKDTQKRLVERYSKILKPGGTLFLGHSESLFNVSNDFELVGNTIYNNRV